MAPLGKLDRVTAEAQAALALREAVVSGALPAGGRITETALAAQMGIGRATVRSALHQLATEGLVTLVPYTGWHVARMTAQDAWELYTLRSAVERLAAQIAATRAEQARPALNAALATLAEACRTNDAAAMSDADFALHKAIIEATGHSRLIEQYGRIEQQIRIYIRSSDALVADGGAILSQHTPIVEAILDGRADRAGQLAEDHNLSEGRKLTRHMAGS